MKQIAFQRIVFISILHVFQAKRNISHRHLHTISIATLPIYTSIRPFIKCMFYLISHFRFQQLQRNIRDSWSYRIAPLKIRISNSYIRWQTTMYTPFIFVISNSFSYTVWLHLTNTIKFLINLNWYPTYDNCLIKQRL